MAANMTRARNAIRPPSELIPISRLTQVIKYDPDTGVFTALVGRRSVSKEPIGYLMNGYRHIQYQGRTYRASRVAWALMTGEWPVGFMDHRDGVRDNDRWANLRQCDAFENMQNLLMPPNKSGFLGVSFRKDRNKWTARICVRGTEKTLGYFATPELAHAAYLAAKREFHTFNPVPRSNHAK